MLFLHTSNHLENLAQQFVHVTRTPLNDIFQAEKIVVQNAGMARWLSLNVADLTGISANMEALFPAEFMWQLLRSVIPNVPLQDPCAPAVLRWRYFHILLQHKTDFPELSRHIGHYISDEMSAWNLAGELSQLLDQTLFYRDDWIRQWEANEEQANVEQSAVGEWQAMLWKKAITDNNLVHWLALQDQFVNNIDTMDANLLPERVSFFSLSALSPGYLRLLGELGKKTDVHLFIINPCMEYWGDIQSEKQIAKLQAKKSAVEKKTDEPSYYEVGNPLLSSMGRQGRDFLDQLLELPNIEEIPDWKESQQPSTLLQKIQHDILHLRHRHPQQAQQAQPHSQSQSKQRGGNVNDVVKEAVVKSNNNSISIHSCHSALREVEVLHDQLLDVIQNNPDIAPADIVVMMPDIETYAPYIDAVFSSTNEASSPMLPFTVADRKPASSQLAIEAMLKLLSVADTRFDVESVFELLDYSIIRENFSLQEEEVVQCRELARATNIRWGISDKARNKDDLPNTAEHTWRYALDRMLLGYALSGDRFFNVSELSATTEIPLLPYTEIEGNNAQILARLKQFTDVVFILDDWLGQRYSIEVWLEKIKGLIKNLFNEEGQIEALFKTLEDLKQQVQLADFADNFKLSFAVVNKIIKKSLEEISGSENFLSKGITFCALMPMRSVPFKVVALLGLNEGEFPRQNKMVSFDPMAKAPRKGDRSRRDEDRYLFLESMLAAREKLLIFYTGQSIKDNTDLPPSVLVSELLETMVCYVAGEKKQNNIIKHPLQAFSPRYFNAESSQLFSYSNEYVELNKTIDSLDKDAQGLNNKQMSQTFLGSQLSELGDEHKQIHLDDLIAFYQSPAREFLKKHFAIKTFDNELVLPVREPFALESFVDRKIRDQIVNSSDNNDDELLLISRAKGLLPHGEIGDAIYNQQQQIMDVFLAQLPELTPRDSFDFIFEVDEFQLRGKINHLTEQGRVIQQSGKAYTRDYISVWINHLVLSSQQPSQQLCESVYYSPESQFSLSALGASEATSQLEQLLAFYWQGLHFPLCFFPKPAFKMYEKNQSKGTIKIAIDAWEKAFIGTLEKDKFENWVLYRAYDNDALFGEEFESVSELLWGEFYRCYNEI